MSILTVPPIWKQWKQEDLERLTEKELNDLWVSLHMNENVLLDRFEYIKYFKDRRRKA